MYLIISRFTKNDWRVSVTAEDKRKLACIVDKLKEKASSKLPPYGKWRRMSSEERWNKIIAQFCVMRGTRAWNRLKENANKYQDFMEKMKLENLNAKQNRIDFLRDIFRKYKPTILIKKVGNESKPQPDIPDRIEKFLKNTNAIRDGKLILFDDLDDFGEDENREILLKRTVGSFKIKSISDLMIEMGWARSFMAFDTRIVGLFSRHFGLNIEANRIQSNDFLYKAFEKNLREVCGEIGVDLSLLDRMLFSFNSAIDYILEVEC